MRPARVAGVRKAVRLIAVLAVIAGVLALLPRVLGRVADGRVVLELVFERLGEAGGGLWAEQYLARMCVRVTGRPGSKKVDLVDIPCTEDTLPANLGPADEVVKLRD